MNSYLVCHLTNGMVLAFNGLCNSISEETLKKCITFNHTEKTQDSDGKDSVLFLAAVPLETIMWIENVIVNNQKETANEATEETNS